MIFTDQVVYLEPTASLPRFFTTTLTNDKLLCTYLHCLFIYEPISPSIVNLTRSRVPSDGYFDFIEGTNESSDLVPNFSYVPVALCLRSKHNFIDFFRKILKLLYLHLIDITNENNDISSAIKSVEFLKYCFILLNDCILPPDNMQFTLELGKHSLMFPYERKGMIPHSESSVAILVDLIDIGNIIEFWEVIVLFKKAFLLSSNQYLLSIIFQGILSIMFPLSWVSVCIPVLSPNLIGYTEAPVPILAGIDTNKISKQTILEVDQEKVILDIDSNMIYSAHISTLCKCVRNSMSKKLQLIKIYYYTDKPRLATYRRLEIENSINDPDFIQKARKLLLIENIEEKEKLFADLIKLVFFDVLFDGLSDIESYLIEEGSGDYRLDKERFIKDKGHCKVCKSSEFWKNAIETNNFEQFIGYYKRYDQSYISKFIEIVELSKNPSNKDDKVSEPFVFSITSQKTPEFILESLLDLASKAIVSGAGEDATKSGPEEDPKKLSPEESSKKSDPEEDSKNIESEEDLKKLAAKEKFKKKSALQIIEDLIQITAQVPDFAQKTLYVDTGLQRKQSFTMTQADIISYKNLFYGKYGIIRCLGTIFSIENPQIYPIASSSLQIISNELDLQTSNNSIKNELVQLKLFYLLKYDKIKGNKTEILRLLEFIDKKIPKILPCDIAVLVLSKIFKKDIKTVEKLSISKGKLGTIALELIEASATSYMTKKEVIKSLKFSYSSRRGKKSNKKVRI
jgi:DENN (AEX-3) domain